MNQSRSPRTFDDIVFENRNKSYGAYQLRNGYNATLNKSLLITLGAFGLFAGLAIAFRQAPVLQDLKEDVIVEFFDLPADPPADPVTTGVKPPAPPVDPIDQGVRPLEHNYQPVGQVPDEHVLPSSAPNAGPTGGEVGQQAMPGTGTFTGTGTLPVETNLPTGDMEAINVDQAPEFPGGLNEFYAYLQSKLTYTAQALDEGVRGKVYASFVIGPDGKPRDVKIIKGLGYGLDEKVLKVLAQSPSWSPGIYKGKPVSVIYRIPVAFEPK